MTDATRTIEALRRAMSEKGLDAYVLTGSDPHNSEYPPAMWQTREWASGFTGSAGTVVVTQNTAGLWTDFRYWIQAPQELDSSMVQLFKDGEPGVPSIASWLAETLKPGAIVAVDGRTLPQGTAEQWKGILERAQIAVQTNVDLVSETWSDRPSPPRSEILELDEDEAGESRLQRIQRLRDALKAERANTWIGVALDSVCWLLNVRGGDVPYNPVVLGYALCEPESFTWYTDLSRVPLPLKEALQEDGVTLQAYEDFYPALSQLDSQHRVFMDSSLTPQAIEDALSDSVTILQGADPVMAMKCRKNPVEINRLRRAMEKDGVALVRFMRELEHAHGTGKHLTEIQAADMLHKQRASIPGFLGESFSTIPAFGRHGAICHYEAQEETTLSLTDGIFLFDSGGQWEEGTTDVTRTLALGSVSAQGIRDYTLTLRGHIALSRARFPQGTRGYQLDAIARTPLWEQGVNFGHGTGHGVGYRLSVHEGPVRISPAPVDTALDVGMVVSNEPGVYREGQHGIRIENLLACREDIKNEFGSFMAFETLTLAPYDRKLIDVSLLQEEERQWVDAYHQEVFRRLAPLLEAEEVDWLKAATAAL